jgi:hypothetical protein
MGAKRILKKLTSAKLLLGDATLKKKEQRRGDM